MLAPMVTNPVEPCFLEIEHKLVVPEDFDLPAFTSRVRALGPSHEKELDTRDTYFLTGIHGHIYRHRLDRELQHLTVKSYGGDNRTRLEVNLRLQLDDQLDAVRAFLQPLGVVRELVIDKRVHVFEFSDCEIVHYVATSSGRTVCCVEIEALGAADEAQGLAVIERYQRELGMHDMPRSRVNLLDIMLGADA